MLREGEVGLSLRVVSLLWRAWTATWADPDPVAPLPLPAGLPGPWRVCRSLLQTHSPTTGEKNTEKGEECQMCLMVVSQKEHLRHGSENTDQSEIIGSIGIT